MTGSILFDKVKRGALDPPFQGFVDFGDGRDLTGLSTATVRMYRDDGTVVVDAALTVVSATTNEVKYEWQAGNTDTAGNNWLEMWFNFSNGDTFKIPPSEFINVVFVTDLPMPTP